MNEYYGLVPPLYDGDKSMVIEVDKVGGGTLGHAYEGSWVVSLIVDGDLHDSTILTTGTPKRHDEAAAIAGQFFADSIDEVDDMETYDRLIVWAGDVLHENDCS